MLDANLHDLGWDDTWASVHEGLEDDNLIPARVAAQHRGEFVLWAELGELRAVRPSARPAALEWSADGRYLLARGSHTIELFDSNGARLTPLGPGAAPVTDAAFSSRGHSIAFLQQVPIKQGHRSFLWVFPRIQPDATRAYRVFAGTGLFGGVEWSPDGRWLLLDWDSADQWLFIRSATVKRVTPVSNVTASFGHDVRLAGWCCP